MNRKFKKIAKNSKKYEFFWHPRCLGVEGVCKILLCLDIVGARGEKNKICLRKKHEKIHYFGFFARAPRMSFDNKILHTPCAPEHLGCQKISYVFEFSCYFFEFTIQRCIDLLFSFATSSWYV